MGPLHVHEAPATPTAASALASTTLLHQALGWWWAEVRAQTQSGQHARAHAQGQEHAHAEAAATAHSHAHAEPAAHFHAGWQRHRHSPQDASVIALDATGEEAVMKGAAVSLLLPVLGAPARDLRIDVGAATQRAWPRTAAARFSSWGSAPLLRPPRV